MCGMDSLGFSASNTVDAHAQAVRTQWTIPKGIVVHVRGSFFHGVLRFAAASSFVRGKVQHCGALLGLGGLSISSI